MLEALAGDEAQRLLKRLRRGIEKESLRVAADGHLAQTPHPHALGSTLTHPHITTDFSEAQLELITGVHERAGDCLAELGDVHRFVHEHIGDEVLWSASMPCMVRSDSHIPVGQFGSSNVGRTKTTYRIGLGWRYGRLMQTISGIHYNFSVPDELWPLLGRDPTEGYFSLIRNFRRWGWLLLYLFGASPAVCRSFLAGRSHSLSELDNGTLYLPHATSLRMGGLGYQSDAQASLHVSYNCLRDYANTLRRALTEPWPEYEKIGLKVNGQYRQLSTSLLQIENEFYGTIRPKRRINPGERPLHALTERGVEYVEVRLMDLNPFQALGIDATTTRFLDTFLLTCLLHDSPPDSPEESARMAHNQRLVVERGRDPELALDRDGVATYLADWATDLLDACAPVAALLDSAHGDSRHSVALQAQRPLIDNPALTPSGRILAEMAKRKVPFFRLAMDLSNEHADFLRSTPLGAERRAAFEAMADRSLTDQRALEQARHVPFDRYLADYMAQELVAGG